MLILQMGISIFSLVSMVTDIAAVLNEEGPKMRMAKTRVHVQGRRRGSLIFDWEREPRRQIHYVRKGTA